MKARLAASFRGWKGSRYFWIAGSSKPIRTGVVATTTSSSMSVKPIAFLKRFTVFFMMITPSNKIGCQLFAIRIRMRAVEEKTIIKQRRIRGG